MNDVFRPCLRKFVLVFSDDILVYSGSKKEHIIHLQSVLSALASNSLVVNKKKCAFGKKEVAYLRHVVSGQGVAVDMEKILVVLDGKQPTNLKELRGFLGLTGYYRKFIRNYAQLALPLTEQLRKDSFGWSSQATMAFEKLKQALIHPPVLILPNSRKTFVLETDASGYGLGAVLMQDGRLIVFFSKILGPRAQHKSIYKKELMAICLAVQKWRHYLLGRHFVVRTDQQSLRYLTQQTEIGADYQKWLSKLMGFSFEIQYKPGNANNVADALSRKSVTILELDSLVTSIIDWDVLDKEVATDTLLEQI